MMLKSVSKKKLLMALALLASSGMVSGCGNRQNSEGATHKTFSATTSPSASTANPDGTCKTDPSGWVRDASALSASQLNDLKGGWTGKLVFLQGSRDTQGESKTFELTLSSCTAYGRTYLFVDYHSTSDNIAFSAPLDTVFDSVRGNLTLTSPKTLTADQDSLVLSIAFQTDSQSHQFEPSSIDWVLINWY